MFLGCSSSTRLVTSPSPISAHVVHLFAILLSLLWTSCTGWSRRQSSPLVSCMWMHCTAMSGLVSEPTDRFDQSIQFQTIGPVPPKLSPSGLRKVCRTAVLLPHRGRQGRRQSEWLGADVSICLTFAVSRRTPENASCALCDCAQQD